MSNGVKTQIYGVVRSIPQGKVATYGQVAQLAGLPRGARFIGTTLSQLPEDSRLPWHRVINSRGELSFPKDSLAWQRQKERLEAEGIVFNGIRLNLRHYQWSPGDQGRP